MREMQHALISAIAYDNNTRAPRTAVVSQWPAVWKCEMEARAGSQGSSAAHPGALRALASPLIAQQKHETKGPRELFFDNKNLQRPL